MSVLDHILTLFCTDPRDDEPSQAADWRGALDGLHSAVPDLDSMIAGRTIVDFGCGIGRQAVAMADSGAAEVLGLDIDEEYLSRGRSMAEDAGCESRVRFCMAPCDSDLKRYDLVLSLNSMEHFGEPAVALTQMISLLRPGGRLLISFDPTWYSPWGAHMHFFCRLPWVHLIFPESTVMRVRSRYKSDGAKTYESVPGGLNRMSVRRFEKLLADSALDVLDLRLIGIRNIGIFGRIPILRECLVPKVVLLAERTAAKKAGEACA